MEGQAKLMRTSSSSPLLRPPNLRSVQSLSTVDEEEGNRADDDDKKTQKPISSRVHRLFSSSSFLSASPSCLSCFSSSHSSVLVPTFFHMTFILPLSLFFVLCFFHVSVFVGIFVNMVLAVAIIAGAFLIARRFGFLRFRVRHGVRMGHSVEWIIGDGERTAKKAKCSDNNAGDGNVGFGEKVEVYANGDYYEGEVYDGKYNGSGVYNYSNNGRYEGDWIDGRRDGYGIESWSMGSRYHGQYRRDLRHGFGVYQFYKGDTYSGGWLNGQSHGVGLQTCSDGSFYVGEFMCGVKHGLGCYHFRNGDTYCGEYFGDKIHGFGVYHFANSHCYEGSWHEGRQHGYGSYTFSNGEARSGEWAYGILRTLRVPSNEALQHAVQAARRAGAKATLFPEVDERVEKSIGAANRAATAARVASIKAAQNQSYHMFGEMKV